MTVKVFPFQSRFNVSVHKNLTTKNSPAHVNMIRADFTSVLHAKAMQLVQPVRDGFTVPPKGQLKRIVNPLLLFLLLSGTTVARVISGSSGRFGLVQQFLFAFTSGKGKSSLYVRLCLIQCGHERNQEGCS